MSFYSFASALDAVITQRKHHTREAKRLRSVAPTITTAAVKARVLDQAREHAQLARMVAEVEDRQRGGVIACGRVRISSNLTQLKIKFVIPPDRRLPISHRLHADFESEVSTLASAVFRPIRKKVSTGPTPFTSMAPRGAKS